ncbi:MAG TPA: ABC transporter ATP-binding protein [Patescibacteria group bacterium]|nr:ABC transporter ATP-binding protein [Patescibacteria group bacterium]
MTKFYRFIKPYLGQEKRKIILIFLFVIASQLLSLIEPVFFAKIIDEYLRDPGAFPSSSEFYQSLMRLVLLWIVVAFGARTFKNLQMYFVETVSDRLGYRVFEKSFAHTLALPMAFHSKFKTGETFRKISKARDDITGLFTVFFDKIFQNAFTITAVLVYVLVRSPKIGIPLFGFVPLFFLVTYIFTKRIKKAQVEINEINEQLYGNSLEALNHVEVVKAFAAEKREQDNLQHDNMLQHKRLKKKTVANQALGFAQGTVINLARVVLLWYGAVLAYNGEISFGDVILFNFYSFYVYQPLYELGGIYTKVNEGRAAVERLTDLLREKLGIVNKENGNTAERLRGKIEFKNVSFSYWPERKILQNVSFVVEPGKNLALVGGTGSGKSTVVKLLLRFYEPDSGQILIDNVDIRDYDIYELRKRIGLVLQDNLLFNATVAENIAYGSFSTSESEITEAASRAQLGGFLGKLANGLQSKVGERGLQVSGGEKQRIAIARSIIKKPSILVFDEATSALDSKTEQEIKQSIEEVSAGITTVTVAHRFATVVNADEILLLQNGKVVERGTHEELLGLDGEYSRLYNLQTQRNLDL